MPCTACCKQRVPNCLWKIAFSSDGQIRLKSHRACQRCMSRACASVCEAATSWVRSPSLQFPGRSSIKPVIGGGGPGYTLCCWRPGARNSRLIFASFAALAVNKVASYVCLRLIRLSFNTSVSFFSRLRSHLDIHPGDTHYKCKAWKLIDVKAIYSAANSTLDCIIKMQQWVWRISVENIVLGNKHFNSNLFFLQWVLIWFVHKINGGCNSHECWAEEIHLKQSEQLMWRHASWILRWNMQTSFGECVHLKRFANSARAS